MDKIEILEAQLREERIRSYWLRELAAMPAEGVMRDGCYFGTFTVWNQLPEDMKIFARERADKEAAILRQTAEDASTELFAKKGKRGKSKRRSVTR